VRITPDLGLITALAGYLESESAASPAVAHRAEPDDAASLLAVASFLRFVSGALAAQIKNMADDEDLPGVWEDQPAIEARLLREQLNLKPVQVGRALARTAEKIRDPGQRLKAAARSEARRKHAARQKNAAKRLYQPLIAALTVGLVRSGFCGSFPDNVMLDELVRRTSVAALAEAGCFNEIEETKPRVGRPRKKRPRTS
jgi:hypothetical protein